MVQEGENYSRSGPFGQVRLKTTVVPVKLASAFDYTVSCGWHECNDLYAIRRGQDNMVMTTSLLLLTVNGAGVAQMAGERYALGRNTAMIIPQGMPHSYFAPPGKTWEFYWIHLSGENSRRILSYIAAEYGHLNPVSRIAELTDYIEVLIDAEYRYYEFEMLAAQMIGKLLFALLNALGAQADGAYPRNALALRVIEYIEGHYRESINLRDLSAQLFLSAERIIRIFKEQTGQTPYQYYKKYRLKKAGELLLYSDLSVKEIAARIGYSSDSAFVAQFRQEMNLSPMAYRRRLTDS